MAQSSIIVEELLAPIPGDNPAGEPVPFAIRNDLEERRKEIDPDQFASDDPMRPAEAKLADWPGIIDVASETLRSKSKDLLVAARLTEALTHAHGFSGLADSIQLLKGMIDQCWDRTFPEISDGDLEVRAGPFNWLSDTTRGARFPVAVRSVAMVHGPEGPFSWQGWKLLQEGKGGSKDGFEKAIAATTREVCQANYDQLTRSISLFKDLSDTLSSKMADQAPPMADLRAALADCQNLAKMILDRKGPAIADSSDGGDAGGSVASGSGPTGNRTEIYRRLQDAADALERLEPHSPIPYLLRRAVSLGNMTFPELIRALLAGGGSLDTINKEFGIKPPEPQS